MQERQSDQRFRHDELGRSGLRKWASIRLLHSVNSAFGHRTISATQVALELHRLPYDRDMKKASVLLRMAHDAFLYLFTGYVNPPEDFDYERARAQLPVPPNWLRR